MMKVEKIQNKALVAWVKIIHFDPGNQGF